MTEGTSKLVIEIESDEADLPVDVALGGICLGLMRYCEKHGLNVMEGLELAKTICKRAGGRYDDPALRRGKLIMYKVRPPVFSAEQIHQFSKWVLDPKR
jgi:hypothetical protein